LLSLSLECDYLALISYKVSFLLSKLWTLAVLTVFHGMSIVHFKLSSLFFQGVLASFLSESNFIFFNLFQEGYESFAKIKFMPFYDSKFGLSSLWILSLGVSSTNSRDFFVNTLYGGK